MLKDGNGQHVLADGWWRGALIIAAIIAVAAAARLLWLEINPPAPVEAYSGPNYVDCPAHLPQPPPGFRCIDVSSPRH